MAIKMNKKCWGIILKGYWQSTKGVWEERGYWKNDNKRAYYYKEDIGKKSHTYSLMMMLNLSIPTSSNIMMDVYVVE